jgi:hypothetical protein
MDVRPRLETVVESYDAMLDEMRLAISREICTSEWSSGRNAMTVVSADAADADAQQSVVAHSALWGFDAAVARDIGARSRLVDLVSAIGRRYGFGDLLVYVDVPGEFQAIAEDDFGAQYDFGGQAHATLSYTTGPHLHR